MKPKKDQLKKPTLIGEVYLVLANEYEDDTVYFVGETEKDALYYIKHIYDGIHEKSEMIISRYDVIHYEGK